MKITLNILIAVLIFGGGAVVFAENNTTSTNTIACTQDAKQCDDGSYVARVGPKCEFAKCPSDNRTRIQKLVPRIKALFENKKELASSTASRIEEREEIKNKIQERIVSSTARIIERRFEKMAKRYLSTIQREETIMAKIESRIAKIKLAGGQTVEAEKFVAESKIHLTEARIAYGGLKIAANNADNATTTKIVLTNMKDSVKVIEKHLREAHKSLQKTIGSLKGVSQLRNASSTKED